MSCPICGDFFELNEIEYHVEECIKNEMLKNEKKKGNGQKNGDDFSFAMHLMEEENNRMLEKKKMEENDLLMARELMEKEKRFETLKIEEKEIEENEKPEQERSDEINIETKLIKMSRVNEICDPFIVDVFEKDLDTVSIRGNELNLLKVHNLILKELVQILLEKKKNKKNKKPKLEIIPEDWQPQDSNLLVVSVERGSEEWNLVESKFGKTLSNQIQKIDKIQNKVIWKKYRTHQELIQEKNSSLNEMVTLFMSFIFFCLN